jgi:hypothetical protein
VFLDFIDENNPMNLPSLDAIAWLLLDTKAIPSFKQLLLQQVGH